MKNGDLLELKNRKLNKPFPVKSNGLDLQVKDVDLAKRTVQFIANTYYWFDKDYDVLVPGCSLKSISERGPASQAVAKIKHQRDHIMRTDGMVGKPTRIEEKVIDGKNVLYYESRIPKGVTGDDHLIKYQEGLYDNHSIGFRYVQIGIAEKESEDEDRVKRWNEYYPLIINKEDVDEIGFFYVVKEIDLYEASVVPFGANSLSGTYGFKGVNKDTQIMELNRRMDLFQKQLKTGTISDEGMKDLELQLAQIKQIMSDVVFAEPDIKDTLQKPSGKSTQKGIDYDDLIKRLK